MLPPHELKSKEFTRVMRGYSSSEVDEHIDFIIEKYTELYRSVDELEKRNKALKAQYEELKAEEDSIRGAMLDARRAAVKITADANERADVIVRSAKTNCDKLVADFRQKIKQERELLIKMKQAVNAFKHAMFENYRTHIEYLEQLSPDIDPETLSLGDDEYAKKIVELIKDDIAKGKIVLTGGMDDIDDSYMEAADSYADIDEILGEEEDIAPAYAGGYIPEPLTPAGSLAEPHNQREKDNSKTRTIPTILEEEAAQEARRIETEPDTAEYDDAEYDTAEYDDAEYDTSEYDETEYDEDSGDYIGDGEGVSDDEASLDIDAKESVFDEVDLPSDSDEYSDYAEEDESAEPEETSEIPESEDDDIIQSFDIDEQAEFEEIEQIEEFEEIDAYHDEDTDQQDYIEESDAPENSGGALTAGVRQPPDARRSQLASADNRSRREQRPSVRDAIRELNKSFAEEEDEEEKLDALYAEEESEHDESSDIKAVNKTAAPAQEESRFETRSKKKKNKNKSKPLD